MIETPNFNPETKKYPTFDEQWEKPTEIEIGSKKIEVQDISPENPKAEVPLIMGLGWSETPDAHKENIRIMTDKGRRVISPEAPHGVETEERENYPTIELRKMAALVGTLEARGVEKADLMGRSEGAIFSVMAAYLYPERFRNLVLINPAGMIGKDNLPRLAVGFSGDLVKQIINDIKRKKAETEKTDDEVAVDALGGVKTLAKNPLRAIQSIFAIADSDIREMLIAIKAKGIGISVIAGVDDGAFPMEKMQKALGLEHVDGFYSTTGSHNSYFLNPKPYSSLIDSALDALEKRPRKNIPSVPEETPSQSNFSDLERYLISMGNQELLNGDDEKPKATTPLRLMLPLEASLKLQTKNIEVDGRHYLNDIPPGRKVIVATTHLTDLDMPVALFALGYDLDFAITGQSTHHDLQKDPPSYLAQQIAGIDNFIPIDYEIKDGGKKPGTFNPENFKPMAEALESGKSVLMAASNPNQDPAVKSLENVKGANGAVYLAGISDAIIVPVAIETITEAKGAGMYGHPVKTFLNKPKIKVHIGKPFEPGKIEEVNRLAELLEKSDSHKFLTKEELSEFSSIRAKLKKQSAVLMAKLSELLPKDDSSSA